MSRKPIVWALVISACVALLFGQTAYAAGGRCGGSGVGAPANLTLVSKTDTTAVIRWSAPRNSGGVAGYNIYRDGALVGAAGKAERSFTDSGLAPNTYYTWTVRAYSGTGKPSSPSNKLVTATPIIIRGTVAWAADTAPREIRGGLIVEQTGFLQIGEGVVLRIKPCQSVTVYGVVDAVGGEGAPIVFTSWGDKAYGGCGVGSCGYWNTLYVAPGGSFSGDFVKLSYAGTLATVKGYLSLTNSEACNAKTQGIFVDANAEFNGIGVRIHDCCTAAKCRGIVVRGTVNLSGSEIYDCPGTGVLVEATGMFNGTSVLIRNCDKGAEIKGSVSFVLCGVSSCRYGLYFNTAAASNFVIKNSFMGNNQYGVYNARYKTVTIDASENYWGSPLGPSVYDPATGAWSQAGDRVSKGVIYDNWLEAPQA